MVSYDHEEPPQGEDPEMALLEGFQWDSLLDSAHSVAPRKRSLSESSVAPGRPAPSLDLFSCHVPGEGGSPPQTRPPGPDEQEEAEQKAEPARGAVGVAEDREPASGTSEPGAQRPAEGAKKGQGRGLQRAELEVEVCGLGVELLDAQGMGKKRRAAGVSLQLGAPPDTARHHPTPPDTTQHHPTPPDTAHQRWRWRWWSGGGGGGGGGG